MIWPKRAGEKLSSKKIRMVDDGKDLRLVMDVISRSHLVAAGDQTKRRVLDWLQTSPNNPGLNNGAPDSCSMRIG